MLPLAFQPRDLRVGKPEVVRDLVHQHVAHQAAKVVRLLDPFQQDRLAVQQHGRRVIANGEKDEGGGWADCLMAPDSVRIADKSI